MILIIGGLLLLSIFALSLNSSIVQNQKVLYQSEEVLDALAIAQKFIEAAEGLRFDENKAATIPSSFVYSEDLGPDPGEHYPFFDDIDDFNGFTQTDTLSGVTLYSITISVNYVNLETPDVPTNSRTYFKRMLINISSEAFVEMPARSIELKKLFSYHYFYTD